MLAIMVGVASALAAVFATCPTLGLSELKVGGVSHIHTRPFECREAVSEETSSPAIADTRTSTDTAPVDWHESQTGTVTEVSENDKTGAGTAPVWQRGQRENMAEAPLGLSGWACPISETLQNNHSERKGHSEHDTKELVRNV